jgi:hypothetical protein
MRKRIFTGLVTLCLILTLVPAFTGSARADYTANGVSLPVSGYGEGAVSNNCRTFAGDVYQAVWGAWLTSYRGTDDDMLRNIPAGSQRAITAENLKKYISVAPAGAAIRITDNIDGNDSQGTRMHSQILAGKDEDGLMIYEGNIGGRVRMKYFTWDSYVQSWGKYVYFKYIKFPDAPAYSAGSGSGGNGWQSAYFWDVPSSAWYSGDVAWTSAAGLVSGKGGGTYDPYGKLTWAETVKLAASLHRWYWEGDESMVNGWPEWWSTYVDYAVKNGIIDGVPAQPDAPISRADYVALLYRALPSGEYRQVNNVSPGSIPDVNETTSAGACIYAFYRAGILSGVDESGEFQPSRPVWRCEVAAVVHRMADDEARQELP